MARRRKTYTGVRTIVKGEKYEIKWDVDGYKCQHRVTAFSGREAFEIRMKEMLDYKAKTSEETRNNVSRSVDFDAAWKDLEDDVRSDVKLKKTIGRYRNTYWRMFGDFRKKYFNHIMRTGQLELSFFRRYKNYYANELGRSDGVRSEFIHVKAIMHRLYLLGYCGKELIEDLKNLKKPPARKKNYPDVTASDINKLLAEIKKERPDYYMLLYFMKRVGRRINESTLIERRDVLLKGLKPMGINIRAETTKMDEDAPLHYLDEDLEKHVRSTLSGNRTKWLFPNKYGRRCHPNRVRDYLKKKSTEVLGVGLTPHYFRHRFCTECGKANIPIADVKAISGIKDTTVLLEFYSHVTIDGQKQVLEMTK